MSFDRTAIVLGLTIFSRCSRANHREIPDVSTRRAVAFERVRELRMTAVVDGSSALSAIDEPPLFAPPAAPAGCTLERPVRSINVGEGPLSFATSAAGARALLAVSTASASTLLLSRSDATLAVLAAPFGPSATLSASGAAHAMVVTWSDASGPQRATPSIAIVNERDEVASFAFDERYALSMTEVLCARIDRGVRCAFALTDRDEFDSNQGIDAARTVLLSTELTPQRSPPRFERRATIHGARGAAVINAARPELSLARDGGLARALSDGGIAPIDPSAIELATIGSNDRALELHATAPTSARCQTGEWNLALRDPRITDASAGTTAVAVMDARPRGARIRASGANGETPLVLWLDAPQCSERLFVIRAHRRGETLALTSATEFDAATDRASLSIAWREGDRLRWARYRCP